MTLRGCPSIQLAQSSQSAGRGFFNNSDFDELLEWISDSRAGSPITDLNDFGLPTREFSGFQSECDFRKPLKQRESEERHYLPCGCTIECRSGSCATWAEVDTQVSNQLNGSSILRLSDHVL